MKKLNTLIMMTIMSGQSLAVNTCWNDSECSYDKVCVCPSSSNNGNCSSPGFCVKREDAPDRSSLDGTKNFLKHLSFRGGEKFVKSSNQQE